MHRRSAAALAWAGLAVLPGACVQTGDFGRVAPTAWNGLLETTGKLAADSRDEPVSGFPLTDDERDLRQRAWRFLVPATPYPLFARMLSELTATRILPVSWHPTDPALYHEGLLAPDFRSPTSRYRRLSEDAVADTRLIPAFAATARRVVEADLMRVRGMPFVRTLSEVEIRDAAARVSENRCLIAWTRHEARARAAAYRYALEHLLIEVPQRDAVAPERALAELDARLAMLANLLPADTNAPCGSAFPGLLAPGEVVVVAKG